MVGSFDEALRAVEKVDGWMTDDQARRLWDRAAGVAADGDRIVEIGSFRGRSTMILALAAAPDGVEVVAIDPHAGNDRGPQEIEGYADAAAVDHEVFHANLRTAGVDDRVRHVRAFSHDALGEVEGDVDLLYIDGAHRYAPALADIRVWGGRVAPGGTMLIHDSFSCGRRDARDPPSSRLRPPVPLRGPVGSMTEYRRELVAGGDRFRNAPRATRAAPVVRAEPRRAQGPDRRQELKKGPWPYCVPFPDWGSAASTARNRRRRPRSVRVVRVLYVLAAVRHGHLRLNNASYRELRAQPPRRSRLVGPLVARVCSKPTATLPPGFRPTWRVILHRRPHCPRPAGGDCRRSVRSASYSSAFWRSLAGSALASVSSPRVLLAVYLPLVTTDGSLMAEPLYLVLLLVVRHRFGVPA